MGSDDGVWVGGLCFHITLFGQLLFFALKPENASFLFLRWGWLLSRVQVVAGRGGRSGPRGPIVRTRERVAIDRHARVTLGAHTHRHQVALVARHHKGLGAWVETVYMILIHCYVYKTLIFTMLNLEFNFQ